MDLLLVVELDRGSGERGEWLCGKVADGLDGLAAVKRNYDPLYVANRLMCASLRNYGPLFGVNPPISGAKLRNRGTEFRVRPK
ncbi:hypothetical protein LOZ80_27535 [Paenibacillus sp. HWE-109]|uniref:hypothetical protein n=1 Tax=Paenibacillus sp. HWE-109 TaxID=1306526 RepID=UPI001EDCC1CB|nr:hypothetical protein [Paenibacillus sp. HWE-109]UKS25321.1 hypothetical protein LOZ80_27535 [Paenibacillus sp. HWE-109]